MKLFYLLLLYCGFAAGQSTPHELAERFFRATANNDLAGFKQIYPDVTALTFFIKSVDKESVYTDAMIDEASTIGTDNAVNSFETLQYEINRQGISLKGARITNILTINDEIQLNEGQEGLPIMTKITKITIQFATAAGKNYSLVIPQTVQIKDRWYISEQQMEISSL
ncbi:hypothetical protein FMM05_04620 [Flavobacterium zepuense]|uniref:Uncharacterized protein n=1 Tax=Flavobacterium zepuense TaxID=2593302 RepID=A0A552V860_9FLAO|nr:hypothetical protein [Flavobacterium zepuense]TRW26666.1 hypothetical protein FMM05_04620 [Flavobacterium zepuense]